MVCVCACVLSPVYVLHRNKELLAAVMQTFKGHVRPMLRHAAASSIIEYAYNDKAVLAQRLMLTEGLYGNTFTVCKVHTHTHTSACNYYMPLHYFPSSVGLIMGVCEIILVLSNPVPVCPVDSV